MTHGSLFSGIGGFDLAAEWMGWENVFHCEWNELKLLSNVVDIENMSDLYNSNQEGNSMTELTVLDLTIKKKWFDMIASGEKKEEYRGIKPYWRTRLHGKSYDVVRFRNGYKKDSPAVIVNFLDIVVGNGKLEWGAVYGEIYYIIKLGSIYQPINQ